MIAALVVLGVVLLGLLYVGHLDREGHRRHVEYMMTAQAAERHTWERERWDLQTRLSSPELVRTMPLPPPTAPVPQAPGGRMPEPLPPELVDDEPDESDLVGTIAPGHGVGAGESL
jgi:hypothetical protein